MSNARGIPSSELSACVSLNHLNSMHRGIIAWWDKRKKEISMDRDEDEKNDQAVEKW